MSESDTPRADSLLPDSFMHALRAVGAQVLTGSDIGEQHTQDWTKTSRGRAAAVVFPTTTEQVSQILKLCNAHCQSVIVQGGHTGMCGGATPDDSGRQIILAMQKMNRIREIDTTGQTITMEAGCVLEAAQQAAADAGLFFPLNLGARGSCQIGGNLATNAGGLNVLCYGTTRELCLGVEAVLPDGRVLNLLTGLRKNNFGYDIKNLLIGSEGTLGVLTAATMRLFPPKQAVLTAWVAVDSLSQGLAVLRHFQQEQCGQLAACEAIPPSVIRVIREQMPNTPLPKAEEGSESDSRFMVLVEVVGAHADDESKAKTQEAAQAQLMELLSQNIISDAVVAQSETQRQEFWHIRESVPLWLAKRGRWKRADVALPLKSLAAFVEDMTQQLPRICPGMYILGFGHLGDGNLHISIRPHDSDPEEYPDETAALMAAVYQQVVAHGGSLSAEHGIGQYKMQMLADYKDAESMDVMKAIKQALDPNNILNPNRVLMR